MRRTNTSFKFLACSAVLVFGGLLFVCGIQQKNRILAQNGNVPKIETELLPFPFENNVSLWEKEISDGERFVLSRHPIAYTSPTLAQLKAENPAVSDDRLSDIPTPIGAEEYELRLQSKSKPSLSIWSLQRVKYESPIVGRDLQILDVVREEKSFVVAWSGSFGVSIDVIQAPPLNKTLQKSGDKDSLQVSSGANDGVQNVALTGSLKNNTLTANLNWFSGAKSSWAYCDGKWIETVKRALVPDRDKIHRDQMIQKAMAGREELKRSLANSPQETMKQKLRQYDRAYGLLLQGSPEPTREEARQDYRKSLQAMSADEVEATMAQWERETTPQRN